MGARLGVRNPQASQKGRKQQILAAGMVLLAVMRYGWVCALGKPCSQPMHAGGGGVWPGCVHAKGRLLGRF